MIGKKFNKWTILREDGKLYGRIAYLCRCECGVEKTVNGNELKRGKSRMCSSCSKIERFNYKGKSFKSYPEYTVWKSMTQRCRKGKGYSDRGIVVCDSWKKSFCSFMEDMGSRPDNFHSIDRIDNDGNYEPSNCRWTTVDVQNNNRRPREGTFYRYIKDRGSYKVEVKGMFIGYYKTEEEAIVARDENIKNRKLKIRIKG